MPASPWRNAQPGVAYVGDAVCAACHPGQAESYHQHPMGRSLAPVAHDTPLEAFDEAAHNPFDRLNTRFAVEHRPGGMVHTAQRRDAQGRVVAEEIAPVDFVLGSGTRGRSYLVSRDGYLFMSPVSWYSQRKGWDLSPGFESTYPRQRVVDVTCLFCHANYVEAVPHTRNRFANPIFRGHAIGCERCHGPGALHVDSRERGETPVAGPDDTIVNPRHLSPVLREGVCQQCHLQGDERFVRHGREPFDYRPGLPLHEFWAVFLKAPELRDRKAVGQVEQMYASRCFQASGGQMGCASCHDPHCMPAARERADYYRARCLSCHQEQGCSLPRAARQQKLPDDSCMACHMPRLAGTEIAHTAVTDHRILRDPGAPEPPRPALPPGQLPIQSFFDKELDPEDPATARDLGVVLVQLSRHPGPARQHLVLRGLPLVEDAVRAFPDDVAAWEMVGWGRSISGRPDEAFQAYETALARAPDREMTLALAASLAERLKRREEALAYTRRLVAVNPWMWGYQVSLARLLARKADWAGARAASEAAVRLNPFDVETRMLHIASCVHTADDAHAEKDLAVLLALDPGNEQKLRDWFVAQRNRTAKP
jgi:hypothetical protein